MKVHYINILMFSFLLNILEHNQRNHKSPTPHTPKIPITRSLCECKLYEPVNYDNDPQMKEVMQRFEDRTSQRFHEYDERMKSTRQKCKEQCDKQIQKIILKDKLEKELMDKFAMLQTDIQSDAIPTCVCEKSLADKVEKGCLRCGGVFGGGFAPGWGLIGGLGYAGWLNSATAAAIELATKKGIEVGIQAVIEKIKVGTIFGIHFQGDWSRFITELNYNTIDGLFQAVTNAFNSTGKTCEANTLDKFVCKSLSSQNEWFGTAAEAGKKAAADATVAAEEAELAKVSSASSYAYSPIVYSVLAILIVVLIMVIIYLVLRYRRKKKTKRKLQYIKLLNE